MRKVLILESNNVFAQELFHCFASRGYHVCGVTNDGAEGQKLIETTAPDVVIMSLLLQSCDGFTVLEWACSRGHRCDFVVLGNFSDERVVGRVIGLGAAYYILKPAPAETVEERISFLFDSRKSENAEIHDRRRARALDERIANIFMSIGFQPNNLGYGYLREGIKLAVNDPRILNHITKELYPAIGEKFGTTSSRVERAMRNAIERAFSRGRTDAMNAIFGARVYFSGERPTNSEFIALIADKLILENFGK